MLIFLLFMLISIAACYCPTGYTYYASTQRCYKVVETPSTYFGAADACSLDDGQLVSIHNAFENSYVTSLIANKNADHWIGLTSMINGWNFTWLDNTAFNYDNFFPSPPSRDYNCVAMKPVASTWQTESCSTQLPFVCIFDPTVPRACPVCPTSCPTCPPPPICGGASSNQVIPDRIPPRNSLTQQDLAFSCPYGYTYVPPAQRCYKIVTDGFSAKSFWSASNDCNLDDAELASIHSLDESEQIGTLLPYSSTDKIYWIGLTSLVNNWGQWTWLDATAINYVNWANGKPDNTQSCAVLHYINYQWTAELCNLRLPYICEFDPTKAHNCPPCQTTCPPCPTYAPCPTSKCDNGWVYFDHTDSCYYFEKEGGYNAAAVPACKAKGGNLASIHSDAENSFILTNAYASGKQPASVIFGLYRTGQGPNDFTYYDHTPVNYTHWDTNQPDNFQGVEFCVEMYVYDNPPARDGYWNDYYCGNTLALYVCEKPAYKN